MRGLEPPRGCPRSHLKAVRLPISPHPQIEASFNKTVGASANSPTLTFRALLLRRRRRRRLLIGWRRLLLIGWRRRLLIRRLRRNRDLDRSWRRFHRGARS